MNVRIIAEDHLEALISARESGRSPGRHGIDSVATLQAARLLGPDGRITERGLAALDTIRRRNPHASPYTFYRPAPEGWIDAPAT